jgi:chaperonin cofactor prefoldin
MTQQNENEIVKKVYRVCSRTDALPLTQELALLEPNANVYKLTGPTLLKQDLSEAKSNVDKRLQYISEESKRLEAKFKELDKKQEEKKNRVRVSLVSCLSLVKLMLCPQIMEGQQQLQQMQAAALTGKQ